VCGFDQKKQRYRVEVDGRRPVNLKPANVYVQAAASGDLQPPVSGEGVPPQLSQLWPWRTKFSGAWQASMPSILRHSLPARAAPRQAGGW
jgi:hypothetical protein